MTLVFSSFLDMVLCLSSYVISFQFGGTFLTNHLKLQDSAKLSFKVFKVIIIYYIFKFWQVICLTGSKFADLFPILIPCLYTLFKVKRTFIKHGNNTSLLLYHFSNADVKRYKGILSTRRKSFCKQTPQDVSRTERAPRSSRATQTVRFCP